MPSDAAEPETPVQRATRLAWADMRGGVGVTGAIFLAFAVFLIAAGALGLWFAVPAGDGQREIGALGCLCAGPFPLVVGLHDVAWSRDGRGEL